LRVVLAIPRATNPAERSSMTECERMRSSAASVRAIGAFREPGHVTACSIPQRANSSTRAWIGAKVRLTGIMPPVSAQVVFVPGFMQRGSAWEAVAREVGERYRSLCLDFATSTFEERVDELLEAAEPGAAVVGYSLGGRIALEAARRAPRRFAAVALVGATPGIEDADERRERVEADDRMAAWMEQATIDEVVARWEQQPIFATQPAKLVKAQRAGRLSHDPAALATLLRSASPGRIPHHWERLPVPLLAIAGERDERYALIAKRVGRARLVPGAGHAAHLEQPALVAALLREFLDEHLGDSSVVDRDT
jgi:2-succinyl-6-hydroxy-2,4-cyclohexadiene-1-carboxylate synthase